MKIFIKLIIIVNLLIFTSAPQSGQQFADIGNFKLESSELIYKCKIGYRTFGKLNQEKSNTVLYPTWFGGNSGSLENLIGPGKLVDSDKYFVIAVDALGDGVSSSPSNCEYQSNRNFPKYTIHDMVNSQYELLTKHLGINHLYGIIGGSMGGMQVFDWIVSYPNFMDKAIAYVGSPKLTSYDLLFWQSELNVIEEGWKCGQADSNIVKTIAVIQNMVARTPQYVIQNFRTEEMPEFLMNTYDTYLKIFNSYNWASQLRAMMSHDVSKKFNGSMKEAAQKVKTDLFIIVSSTDLIVNPNSALEFAELADAESYIFENNCGHLAPGCEMSEFVEIVNYFFDD